MKRDDTRDLRDGAAWAMAALLGMSALGWGFLAYAAYQWGVL